MPGVLLLNATYEPIRVVTLPRAIGLVIADKAEIVEQSGDPLRSAHRSFPTPTVIRLIAYVKIPYRAKLPLTRNALMARDGSRCQYCGKHASTVDHVVPRSKGGQHVWENVVMACGRCNGLKADKTLEQLGWALRTVPKAPVGWRWRVVAIGWVDPSWEPYLQLAS